MSTPQDAALDDFKQVTGYNQWNTTCQDQWITQTNANPLEQISLANGELGCNLQGYIPATIGNLKDLKQLQLPFSELTNNIPFEIGNLTNLEYLYLQGCQLNGSIPSSIGNLVNLERLLLFDNHLTGNLPDSMSKLNNLKLLNLGLNNFNGTMPSFIFDQNWAPQLEQLYLCSGTKNTLCIEDLSKRDTFINTRTSVANDLVRCQSCAEVAAAAQTNSQSNSQSNSGYHSDDSYDSDSDSELSDSVALKTFSTVVIVIIALLMVVLPFGVFKRFRVYFQR